MIRIVTGKLGAGKTLYSTMLICDMFCEGKIVFTNIDIQWEEMKALAYARKRVILDDRQFISHDLRKFPNWHEHVPFGVELGCVEVFLDEIHLFFNSRDWQATAAMHKMLLSFLSQSRKARVNVTFITQEITNVEKQFRVLAEWEEKIIPSSHMPLGVVKSLPFKFFFVVYKDIENGNTVNKSWRRYDKRYFKAYKSFQFLDSDMHELSENAVRMAPIKLRKGGYLRWLLAPGKMPTFAPVEQVIDVEEVHPA